MLEADLERLGIELQSEARLYQGKSGGARPSLRRARDRIHRGRGGTARKAAEQLGEASRLPIGNGIEHALENSQCRILEPVPREPDRDHRIIVRPNRSVVIRDWIVASC